MKDLGEGNYVLGILLFWDRKNKMVALSQSLYIDKILKKFAMQDSTNGGQPSRTGMTLSLDDYPKTFMEKDLMEKVHYTSAVEILCITCFA